MAISFLFAAPTFGQIAGGEPPCQILVVDDSNDWPVPLVELTTVNHVRFVSDNAGLIAFDLPELMNRETLIHPEFVREDSPLVIFEGTFTRAFSKAATETPRYDYNQILYRLDLGELSRADDELATQP